MVFSRVCDLCRQGDYGPDKYKVHPIWLRTSSCIQCHGKSQALIQYTRKTPPLPGLSKWYIPFSRLPFCLDFSSTFEINTCQISAVLQGSLTQDTQRQIAAFSSLRRTSCPSPTQPWGKSCQNNGQPHKATPKAHFQCMRPLTLLITAGLWSTYGTTSGANLPPAPPKKRTPRKLGWKRMPHQVCRAYALC